MHDCVKNSGQSLLARLDLMEKWEQRHSQINCSNCRVEIPTSPVPGVPYIPAHLNFEHLNVSRSQSTQASGADHLRILWLLYSTVIAVLQGTRVVI